MKSDRRFRTELPNLFDDAGLDPYSFRLLAHYARVGKCWESTRTTGARCRMSQPSVVRKRRWLAKNGYIKLGVSESGTIKVEVIDHWRENFDKYSRDEQPSDADVAQPVQPENHTDSDVARGDSVVSPKKNSLRRTNEEKPMKKLAGADTPVHPAVQVFRSVRRRYPPRETWISIAESVGNAQDDLDFWRDVLIGYAGLGWNRQSISGPLEWFNRRELPHVERGNGHGKGDGLGNWLSKKGVIGDGESKIDSGDFLKNVVDLSPPGS